MSPENMSGSGPEGFEPERAGAGSSGSTFKWLEETLQELVQSTTEVIRRGREAKAHLDEVTRELEQMRLQRHNLLTEVEGLERRRVDLETAIEADRMAAASHVEQMRTSAEAEVTALRQSKERLEREIRALEERRADVGRQIEEFLRDQLSVLRRMDAEAKAVANVFRTSTLHAGGATETSIQEPAPKLAEQPAEEVPERTGAEALPTPSLSQVSIVAKGFPDIATLIAFQKAVEQLSSVSRIDTREFRDGRLYLRVSVRDRSRLEAEIGQLPGIPVSAVTAAPDAVCVDLPSEPRSTPPR